MRPINARVSLSPTDAGGRSSSINLQRGYRPHLRVGTGEMLGVEFTSDSERWLSPGETAEVELKLLYEIDYSSLAPGTSFTILEGLNAVGTGSVV